MTNEHVEALEELQRAIGRRVVELRAARGMSQEDFGIAAGAEKFFANRVENGGMNLSLASIARMALALDVTLSEFFEGVVPSPGLLKPRPRRNSRHPGYRTDGPRDG